MEEEEGKDKCHWTEAERLTAVNLIHKRYAELYGKFKGATLGAKQKMAIWHSIVAKHNSSGVAQNVRTVENIKVMYKNVKSRAKVKNAERHKTGGGPKPRISVAEEEVLIQLRNKPQLRGIEGAIETTGSDADPETEDKTTNETEEGHSSDGMEEYDFPGDPSDRNSQVNDPRLDNQTHTKERTVPKEVGTEKVPFRTAGKRKRDTRNDQLYQLEVKRAELEIKIYEQSMRHKQELFILEKESLIQKNHQDSVLFNRKKELLEANLKHAVENQLFTFEP